MCPLPGMCWSLLWCRGLVYLEETLARKQPARSCVRREWCRAPSLEQRGYRLYTAERALLLRYLLGFRNRCYGHSR